MTPEHQPLSDFCGVLASFLAARVDPLAIDAAGAIPPAHLDELARLGALSVSLPASHGGAELGLVGATAVVDVIARRDRALATTVGLHLGLGTRALVTHGTAAQHDRWLPSLATGERIAAFSATEPAAGSDLSKIATRITPTATGRLRVDGQKIFVTNGGLAGLFTVAAASPGLGEASAGQSLIVLERSDAGLTIGPEEHKLGLRGSSTTPLFLDAVAVPADRLLGPPGHGQELIGEVLAWGRTIMAAGCAGTAHAALDLARAHVRERKQFGRALAHQPVVRAQLAEMGADLFTMRALIAHTAALEADRAALERASLVTKVIASDLDWQICDRALQLLGGMGYIEHSGAPLLLRDARITRIFEGANDVLLTRLGLLEAQHPKTPSETGTTADAIQQEVHGVVAFLRDALGLSLFRKHAELHWLGRLVAARDAALALVPYTRLPEGTAALGLDGAACHWAQHALARIERMVCCALLDRDAPDAEPLAQALLEEHA